MKRLDRDAVARFAGYAGELLITAGAIVLLFVAWQMWINNALTAAQQQGLSRDLAQSWSVGASSGSAMPGPSSTVAEDFGPAPAFGSAALGAKFATITIPRLGPDSTRVVVNSLELGAVLNHGYFGHYPDSQWPGQPGNFALAVHRTNWGSPFGSAPALEAGDPIVVETEAGYYTYRVRNYEYVLPTQVEVVLPVPGLNVAAATQSLITITTCNPLLGDAERLIVYGVLDSWRPHSAGAPKLGGS